MRRDWTRTRTVVGLAILAFACQDIDPVATTPAADAATPGASTDGGSSGGDDACVETFFDTVGKRLYRRPLSEDEKARYRDLRDNSIEQTFLAQYGREAVEVTGHGR